ncbi:MAG: hypothetical protein ACRD59_00830 [Candidatus Acidiferrales bacterium]
MSITPANSSLITPDPLPEKKRGWHIRMRWKWSLTIVAAGLLFLMWQCGTALFHGYKLGDAAAQNFHKQLNAEQYEAICAEADEGFRAGETHDKLVTFLSVVHRKLGDAGESKFVNMNVNATISGTFTTETYETKFAKGDATEIFTWIKKGGELKLYSYNINSMALIMD